MTKHTPLTVYYTEARAQLGEKFAKYQKEIAKLWDSQFKNDKISMTNFKQRADILNGKPKGEKNYRIHFSCSISSESSDIDLYPPPNPDFHPGLLVDFSRFFPVENARKE